MFYNLGFAGRAMRRMGAIEFVTTIAPGLKDVILTGKIKECVVRTEKSGDRTRTVYDEVVVDAPPTGRIAGFLDVTKAMADVAKGGPIASQAEGVSNLLRSELTVVHLVTLLEALPVQETADATAELTEAGFRVGTVVVNRATEGYLPAAVRKRVANGDIDVAALRTGLYAAGIDLSDTDLQGIVEETTQHCATLQAQDDSSAELSKVDIDRLYLPTLPDGMDLGGIYELSEHLSAQGVR
jgi:anion-transporting  ArsA/GET3 family ATPase